MVQISLHNIQKKEEKFKRNEEFLKKLKKNTTIETIPIVRIPSPQAIKIEESPIGSPNNSMKNSPKKRPSIFSGKTLEESPIRKIPLPQKDIDKLNQQSTLELKRPSQIDPQV